MIVFVLGKVRGRLELVSCFLEIVRIFGFGLLVRVIFYGWIIEFVGIVSFIVEGGIDRGRRFLNSLEMFSHTANLGDSRTIATHPASTTHSKLTDKERLAVGIAPGLIRISVGLEHISDIILEVKEALKKSN